MSTRPKAEELAKLFDAEGIKTDYWKFDSADGKDEIFIVMTRAPKGKKMMLKSAVNDSYWISAGPPGSLCGCCNGSGRA